MKISSLLFLFFLWGGSYYLVAQPKQGYALAPRLRGACEKQVTIDTAYLRVYYAFNAEDLNDYDTYIDLQCLEVGRKQSKYYSAFWATADSLSVEWSKSHPYAGSSPQWFGEGGRFPDRWSEYQFSVIFKSGNRLKVYAAMPHALEQYNCRYEESYPLQEWTIRTDTLTVCGHLCQKAVCSYRGRQWIAWFSAAVPVSDGPWKLGGLPGLILKAYDSDELYTFECIGLEQGAFPLVKWDYSRFKARSREKVLKLQKGINEDYFKMTKAVDIKTGKPVSKFTPYEPLELE